MKNQLQLIIFILFSVLFLIMCSQAQYIQDLQKENKLSYNYQSELQDYINQLEDINEILNNSIIDKL